MSALRPAFLPTLPVCHYFIIMIIVHFIGSRAPEQTHLFEFKTHSVSTRSWTILLFHIRFNNNFNLQVTNVYVYSYYTTGN